MKFAALLVLFSQLVHAEHIKQAALWNDCIQSYKQSKSVFFDVTYNENDPKNHLIFRHNKFIPKEAINIFHDGQLWTAEIKIATGFYDKKNALVIMGNEKFCLTQEFNWLRPDSLLLLPFNEKTCNATITYDMGPAQIEPKPNVEDILLSKMKNDVNMAITCIRNFREDVCNDLLKSGEYQRLLKWNTQACEKIDNAKLKNLIADKKRIITEYPSQYLPQEAPAAVPKTKSKVGAKTKN